MSTASQGRYTEHRVARHMTEHGWELIVRAAASKGPADLVMAHETHGGALVQVGRKSKTLGPADRARLLRAAWLLGALPILAVCVPRQAPKYWLISDGTPRTWALWHPNPTNPATDSTRNEEA